MPRNYSHSALIKTNAARALACLALGGVTGLIAGQPSHAAPKTQPSHVQAGGHQKTVKKAKPGHARTVDPAKKPGWVLTFRDEFNGPSVDTTKWNIYDKAADSNQELEYYAPDEVSIHGGSLRLTSRKRDYKQHIYTSGAVNSHKKFSQTYGLFEVRAKLPGTRGMWPAHWLLPENEQWPPEIDIMEMLGHEPTKIYTTNHWTTPQLRNNGKGGFFVGPDSTQGFHTYAVDWEPGKIRWLIDGVERFVCTDGVPDVPMYIILNTAVGGDWPGNPDATTKFPQYHDIDYVRVYKKQE